MMQYYINFKVTYITKVYKCTVYMSHKTYTQCNCIQYILTCLIGIIIGFRDLYCKTQKAINLIFQGNI